jgi:hypothetical protein
MRAVGSGDPTARKIFLSASGEGLFRNKKDAAIKIATWMETGGTI